MIPIVSLLAIVGTSLIITRIASVALEHTGIGRDSARFQARSAFTGVGFTTSEAESIVDHPVRRRIVMWLMLVGNVGMASAMAALLLSAIDLRNESAIGLLLAVLVGGLGVVLAFGSNKWLDHQMCRAIGWALRRWTTLDASDSVRLLHLREEYSVMRIRVAAEDWLAGKLLSASRLSDEGLVVLGIECPDGNFIGAPPGDIEVRAGDELVVYGTAGRVAALDRRGAGEPGEQAHAEATEERARRIGAERQMAGR